MMEQQLDLVGNDDEGGGDEAPAVRIPLLPRGARLIDGAAALTICPEPFEEIRPALPAAATMALPAAIMALPAGMNIR